MSTKEVPTIYREHIIMLKNAYWRWADAEYGAPAIDDKRPFGNSDVKGDLARMFGIDSPVCRNCGVPTEDVDTERYEELFRELVVIIPSVLSGLVADDFQSAFDD